MITERENGTLANADADRQINNWIKLVQYGLELGYARWQAWEQATRQMDAAGAWYFEGQSDWQASESDVDYPRR